MNVCVEYLISNGISPERLVANGKGESEPYVLTVEDTKHDERGGFFLRRYLKKETF